MSDQSGRCEGGEGSRELTPEAWAEVDRLFRGAFDLDPEQRAAWLSDECPDLSLRGEVERLLRAHDDIGDFLSALDTEAAAALVSEGARIDADPESVGPYRIVRRLARGGMGIVFLARDDRLDRFVALKLLPPGLDSAPATRERFLAEARAASRLDHPHIATVHDMGETPDGGLYIAMSYYEGETLAERIGRGPLRIDEALTLAAQVAEALSAAHAAGIVHRDIKPGNVVVTAEGQARVLDFGIAKTEESRTTRAGLRLGTVAYMSPEQTRGETVDTRTDVWSFGVLLYEMLAGRRPFAGPDDAVVIHAIRHDDPKPIAALRPEVSDRVRRLLERCLAKDPSERFADGRALTEALGALAGAVPGTGDASFPIPRRLSAVALLVLTFAALVGLTLLAGRLSGPDSPAGAGSLDPDLVLVLPFPAVDGDTMLDREGRNLAITLSTALDGLGELHTIDPSAVAAQTASGMWTRGDALSHGFTLARDLGAGRVIHGTLLRRGGGTVRSDLAIYRTPVEDEEIAAASPNIRAVATAELADIGALTDSVTRALLPHLWPTERTPEVEPNALSERPLPALRAFLEGELATADGRWREAPEFFARAIEIDSTFWLAYARYVEAMDYWSRPVDPEIRSILDVHLADLPAHERALREARRADSLSERLSKARDVTERFPTSWRAWFGLAEQLIHNTMFLGTTLPEARSAIERTATLNPNRGTHWQHLLWLALADRDTTATARALKELERLEYDAATLREAGLDQLQYYRYLHRLAAAGDSVDADEDRRLRATADSLAVQLVDYAGPIDLEELGGGVSVYGPHHGEILLAQATLDLPVSAPARAGMLRGLASAWAGRGDWDAALATLDRYVSEVDGVEPLRHALRLSVMGEWLGVLGSDAVDRWRAAVASTAEEATMPGSQSDAPDVAELAWLDGITAYARRDTAALTAALGRLATIEGAAADPSAGPAAGAESARADSIVAALLSRSLRAHRLALSGHRAEAADSLIELERQRAERYWFRWFGNRHPYLSVVNRIDAARWLLDTGRAPDAVRLLRWHRTVQFPAYLAHRADATLRGVIHYYRGRAESGAGHPERAAEHYRRTLSELDRPVEALVPLLDSARVATRRSRQAVAIRRSPPAAP